MTSESDPVHTEPGKVLRESISPQNKTKNEGTGAPEQSSVVSDIVPSPPSNDKTEKCRYPTTPWWKTAAEMIGIGAVVAYTIVSCNQWRTAERQLNITERAWIGVVGTQFTYVTDSTGISRADGIVVLKNTGLSPAFKIHAWRCAEVREIEPSIDAGPPGSPQCIENDLGLIVGSGILTFEMPDRTKPIAKDSLPKTAYEPGPHLYAWGKVTYETLSKDGPHFTSFCLLSAGSQLAPCINGNNGN